MALSANRNDLEASSGDTQSVLLQRGQTIYQGALVHIGRSGANVAGRAAPLASGDNRVAAGVAEHYAKSGSDDDKTYVSVRTKGEFEFKATGAHQNWVGSDAYGTDDETVINSSASNAVKLGVFTGFISATRMRVRIEV